MKAVNLRNKLNGEKFVCENMKEIQTIDGVDYIVVHRTDSSRNFLMRKDVLEKDPTIKNKDKITNR